MPAATGFTAVDAPDGLHDVVPYTLMAGPTPPYPGPFAVVTFSMSMTVPTGAYQNVKPMVQLEVPCHPAKLEEAYLFAQNWCNDKLTEMRQVIEATIAGGA